VAEELASHPGAIREILFACFSAEDEAVYAAAIEAVR
jgi:hypothetical protein